MLPFRLLCAAFVWSIFASAGFAQGVGASPPRDGEGPHGRVVRIFAETSPGIGQPLPDLTCFDAQGKQFHLRSLKGHHTVLLFGCLT